jgi:hypothetical protein
MTDFSITCTGDIVVGDTIRFTEGVFGGSLRRPTLLGRRTIEAVVKRDSYGAGKQQHTFTLLVLSCAGAADILANTISAGSTIQRKGRNVYRNGTHRKPWADEAARHPVLAEKHARGGAARTQRDIRRGIGT